MQIYLFFEKIRPLIEKTKPFRQPVFLCLLIAILSILSYVLLHNPHQQIQHDLFATAQKIHHFYRDRPGYWQLSTNTAKEDKLLVGALQNNNEYDVRIGQGLEGDTSLPSDMNFNIVLQNLNKSACINLSELPIDEESRLILQKITLINDAMTAEYAWGAENPLPIARYSMRQKCQPTGNTLVWTFH
jgi:hypothetical protein